MTTIKHLDDIRTDKCDICSKSFKTRNLVVKHLKRHVGGYFECDIYRTVLSCKNDLKHHKELQNCKKMIDSCEEIGGEDFAQKLPYNTNLFDKKTGEQVKSIMEDYNMYIKKENVKIDTERDIMERYCATMNSEVVFTRDLPK